MTHTNTRWFGSAVMLAMAGIVVVVAMQWRDRDVAFCRGVFSGLAHGRQWVQKDIAWERFKALDQDVGSVYAKLPNDRERSLYRQAFVTRFAEGFAQAKARIDVFGHWRVLERRPDETIVAAEDSRSQRSLLFLVPNAGAKRLEGIQWQ